MRCNTVMAAICLPLSVGVPGVITRSASMEFRGGGVPISPVVSFRGNANSGSFGNVIRFGNSGNAIDINNSCNVITPGNSGNSGSLNGGGSSGVGTGGVGAGGVGTGGVGAGGSNQENSKIKKRNIYPYAPPIVQTDIAALACGKSNGCPPPLVILHRRHPLVILHRRQPVVITASATPAGDTRHPRHPMSNGRIEPENGVPGGVSAGPIDLGGL